ncbi:hypothetical protein Tco_0245831 [Tanacetum coccineum]
MNYIPVSVGKIQVNVDEVYKRFYVYRGSSGKDKGPTQEYILLLLQPHRTRIPVEDVPPAAHEKPSKSYPKDNDVQDRLKICCLTRKKQQSDEENKHFKKKRGRNCILQKKAAQATSTNILSTDRPSVSTNRLFVNTDRPSVSTDRPFISTDRPSVSIASTPQWTNA